MSTPAKRDTTAVSRLTTAAATARSVYNAAVTMDSIGDALEAAGAIEDLRKAFDHPEIQGRITNLANTPLGFRTDHDPAIKDRRTGQPMQPYPYAVVKEAAIEACLRGLQLVGNHFNIIAGRFYCTKEGFIYLLSKLDGFTDFAPVVGVPQNKNGGAVVECSATWKMHGKPGSMTVSIPIKTDSYSGADQIIGKATRKFLARVHAVVTGQTVPEGEAGDSSEAMIDRPLAGPVARQLLTPRFKASEQATMQYPQSSDEPSEPALSNDDATQSDGPLSPNEQLARRFSDAGLSFGDLKTWNDGTEAFEIPQTAESFDDLSAAVVRKISNAAKALIQLLNDETDDK